MRAIATFALVAALTVAGAVAAAGAVAQVAVLIDKPPVVVPKHTPRPRPIPSPTTAPDPYADSDPAFHHALNGWLVSYYENPGSGSSAWHSKACQSERPGQQSARCLAALPGARVDEQRRTVSGMVDRYRGGQHIDPALSRTLSHDCQIPAGDTDPQTLGFKVLCAYQDGDRTRG